MGVDITILNPGSFCLGWAIPNDRDHIVDIYLFFIAISIFSDNSYIGKFS